MAIIYERFFLGKWLRYRYLILFIAISILLMTPQLFVSHPNLIDDGVDFYAIRARGALAIYDDFVGVRTYPLRIAWRFIFYKLFGLNIPFHFLGSAVLLGITCWLFYLLLRRLGIKEKMSVLTTFLIFILPSTWANYFRLGTAERLQAVFLLGMVILLLAKRFNKAFLIYLLAILTKETSIFYGIVPLFIFYKKEKFSLFYLTLGGTLTLTSYIFSKVHQLSQLTAARFGWQDMISHFKMNITSQPFYYIVLFLSFAFLFYLVRSKGFGKLNFGYLVLALLNLASLPCYFIWPSSQWHYFFPSHLWLLMLSVYTLGVITSKLGQKRKIGFWGLLIVAAAPLFCYSVAKSLKMGEYWHRDYILNGALVGYLLNHDLSEEKIYSGISDPEINSEIYFYATHLEKDTTVNFLPEMDYWWSFLDRSNDQEFKKMSSETIENFSASKERGILIADEKLNLPKINVEPICGESPFMKKDCRYFVYTNANNR
jgi:hypothetical protein